MPSLKNIKDKIKKYSFRQLIHKLDDEYGIRPLETFLAKNWFNPLATLWVNFRSFPLNQAIKLPMFVYGRPRIYATSGSMRIEGKVKTGMIQFNVVRAGAPSLMSIQSEFYNRGTIKFHGNSEIGTGNRIVVSKKGILSLGNFTKISDMCNIGCFSLIDIGELTRIAHRCQLLDSNYHFVANFNKMNIAHHTYPIKIGSNCWIGNSTTIAGGTVLPDYTIVGSNSLVNKSVKNIPENSIIGGIPAKLIATGFRRVNNSDVERELWQFFANNPDSLYPMQKDMSQDYVSKSS